MPTATAEIIPSAATVFPADRRVSGHLGAEGMLSDDAQRRLIVWFLALGALARCVRYFLHFPLWEDECFLCINLVDRGYLGLLEPLQYHQVAPPMFLWVERTVVELLGFNEWALRLFPFLCGLASLFLFRHVAGRLVRGPALVFAVATFAVAYSGIRYSAEAKQYGSDLFVSLAMIALTVEWWRDGRSRWLWMLAGSVPIAVGLSYPATFIAGGASLFVGAVLVRERPRRLGWRPWIAFNMALLAGFAVVFAVAARGQSGAELEFMTEFWDGAFPPWRTPLRLPLWLLDVHVGDFFSYPIGGGNGGSTLTFLAVAAGTVLLARRKEHLWLLLALAPFAVHFAAAIVERYPYGSHVKFSQHLAPSICLLTGLGGTVWIGLLRKAVTSDELRVTSPAATRRSLAHALLVVTLLFPAFAGAGSIVRDVWHPYKNESDMRARAFARWFWFNSQFEGEVVCLTTDLDRTFSPEADRRLSWTAMYLCNQRIYSPRHQAGDPPRLDAVSASRPLRCVLYRDPRWEFDDDAFAAWLAEQQSQYRIVGRETYEFPRYDKRMRHLITIDYLEEFKFVPRDASPARFAELELDGARS